MIQELAKTDFKNVLDYHAFQINVTETDQERIGGTDAEEVRT